MVASVCCRPEHINTQQRPKLPCPLQVPQDMVLFNDTIYYNIAYGDLSAGSEEVHSAAKQAAIHDQVRSAARGVIRISALCCRFGASHNVAESHTCVLHAAGF